MRFWVFPRLSGTPRIKRERGHNPSSPAPASDLPLQKPRPAKEAQNRPQPASTGLQPGDSTSFGHQTAGPDGAPSAPFWRGRSYARIISACKFGAVPGFRTPRRDFLPPPRPGAFCAANLQSLHQSELQTSFSSHRQRMRVADQASSPTPFGTRCTLIRSRKDIRHDDLADLNTLNQDRNTLSLEKVNAR